MVHSPGTLISFQPGWNSDDENVFLSGDGLNFQVPLRLMEEPTGTGMYCEKEFNTDIRIIVRLMMSFFIMTGFTTANLL
jgi:hypothetical protein